MVNQQKMWMTNDANDGFSATSEQMWDRLGADNVAGGSVATAMNGHPTRRFATLLRLGTELSTRADSRWTTTAVVEGCERQHSAG
jgi:hypothetical protein